ncbi:retrovirus-related pol polyprotein from transposon TNT 1-94 [Tanacetum coccineum]
MAAEGNVPQLDEKKGGSYSTITPKLEPENFNKWKKRMLYYLTDDIIELVISCETTKSTWTDLVHTFKDPSDTKIMDLKIKYQTFRAKPFESISQIYTRYNTLINELTNDDVTLSKHEINMGFMNSLPEKWLSFSQGLRTVNHTPTLDLDDIYRRFIYKDNLISRRYLYTKKDFQENSDDEANVRSSKEYLTDLELQFYKRPLLANSKHFIKRKNNFSSQKINKDTECYKCGKKGHFARDCFSKTYEPSYKSLVSNSSSVSKGFQPKFTPKLIQSSQHTQSSQSEIKFQKDYKAEYKKMKAKPALLKASPSTSQSQKPFQSKKKGLVDKTFD